MILLQVTTCEQHTYHKEKHIHTETIIFFLVELFDRLSPLVL
jgi:hypothetical protein